MLRGVFDHGLSSEFRALDLVVPGHEMDHLGAELAGQFRDKLGLLVGVPAVADKAAEPHTAALSVLQDAAGNVVRRVHGHHLARGHDVDLLGLAFPDRHGKPAADHVAENVVEHEVRVIAVGAVLFKKIDGCDHAAARAAHARLRPARLGALDVLETVQQHLVEF